jgi:hypothetical protein
MFLALMGFSATRLLVDDRPLYTTLWSPVHIFGILEVLAKKQIIQGHLAFTHCG